MKKPSALQTTVGVTRCGCVVTARKDPEARAQLDDLARQALEIARAKQVTEFLSPITQPTRQAG